MSLPRLLPALLLALLGSRNAVASSVEIEVIDRERATPIATHTYRGMRYIAGAPGQRYALRLTNQSNERVLVVLSVDGINAISGETAAYGQTGYVLEAWASAEVAGWRKNMSETAAFYFAALPESYAARTGRPDNVGVIGAAVFSERVAPPMAQPAPAARSAESAAPQANDISTQKAERLGTGHGEREYAPSRYTEFVRARSTPDEVIQIRYDSYARLVAAGVIRRVYLAPPAPQAFPGFVADPPR